MYDHNTVNCSILTKLLEINLNKLIFFSVRLLTGSVWSFGFFIPATTANDLPLGRISIPDLIHYIIFLSEFLRKGDVQR